MKKKFSTEDVEDMELDEAMDEILKFIDAHPVKGTWELSEKKKEIIEFSYEALKFTFKGEDVTITRHTNEFWGKSENITINGKNISIAHPDLFSFVARMAGGFEVVPKLDGTVELNVAFRYDVLNKSQLKK
jgi:hypothetical protein